MTPDFSSARSAPWVLPHPAVPFVHLLIGAGVGFYTWSKTQSALFALLVGAVSAWLFSTRFERFLALLAIAVVHALLFFSR